MKPNSKCSPVIRTKVENTSVDPKNTMEQSISPALPPEQFNMMKTFPWMTDFHKLCLSEIAINNFRSLEKLMTTYQKLVTNSVAECYSRPNRAAKLKRAMSDMLMFFYMSYTDLKLPIEHSSYQAIMSDLMAMYMDMEIKASRTGTESLQKIASMLTSSLHVYFGKSHELILDTILKTKMVNKNSWELSDLIFRRLLRDSLVSSIYVPSYIRYLLVFKMWKGVMKSSEDRRKITKLASVKLKPPLGFKEKLSSDSLLRDILPKIPKTITDITTFFMQAKYLVKDKAKMFLKAMTDPKHLYSLDHHIYSLEQPSNSNEKEDSEVGDCINVDFESIFMNSGLKQTKSNKNRQKSTTKSCYAQNKMKLHYDEIGEDDKEVKIIVVNSEDSPISVIKSEVEEIVSTDQVNTSICEGDNMEVANEVELPSNPAEAPAVPTIKLEPQTSSYSKELAVYPTMWGLPTYQRYQGNHITYDSAIDSKSDEFSLDKAPDDTEKCFTKFNVFEILNKSEFSDDNKQEISINDDESVHTQETTHDNSEEIIVDDFKPINAVTSEGLLSENFVPENKFNVDPQFNDDKNHLIHTFTVENDQKMYELQSIFYPHYVAKLTSQTVSNLFGPLSTGITKVYRCNCKECLMNFTAIRKNWNFIISMNSNYSNLPENKRNDDLDEISLLKEFKAKAEENSHSHIVVNGWDSEFDMILKRIDELIKEDRLPPKKRVRHYSFDINYPNQVMMSIAQVVNDSKPTSNYQTNPINTNLNNFGAINNGLQMNYSAINFPILSQTKCESVIVQSDNKNMIFEPNPVPGAFTTTFVPEQQRVKFKTPAQLKEFKHFSAAQDLINFAHTSRSYFTENGEPQDTKKVKETGEKRQTRSKTKSSKKKKRT